jgi:glycosyltransferase involved in cell wall biosynthesis
MINVAVIVPAFNEAKSLPGLIASLKDLHMDAARFHIVVVNDGSADATADIVRANGVTLLDLPVNLGIGAAVQTGLIYAWQNDFHYALQVDGDGQHPPDQIPLIIAALADYDLVIGSRFLGSGTWRSSTLRRFGIRYLNAQIRLMCGLNITDCTSGFRGFSRKALEHAASKYPDQYPEPESIIMFRNYGLRLTEVPVRMMERREGRSSIRAMSTVYYMLKVSLAILFTHIRTKYGHNG